MMLSDLASIATVISSIAVLMALIYLALQMGQNTRHMRALILQARNRQAIDINMFAVGDPAVAEIFLRGDDGDPTLTRTQMFAYLNLVNTQIFLAEDQFYQHGEGLIGDDHHAGLVAWLKYGRGVYPGFRAMWEILRGLYRGEFRAFIDGKMREAASVAPPDVYAQWLASTATERARTKDTPETSL